MVLAVTGPAVASLGCGGDDGTTDADDEQFDTFQGCYDDHFGEGGDAATAIAICCLDHPIGTADKNVVCGASEAACATYVNANLASPAADDVTTACSKYITERNL